MNNEPAFPTYHGGNSKCSTDGCGMTLRDYFASKAMPELLHIKASVEYESVEERIESVCKISYGIADAMMEARSKK